MTSPHAASQFHDKGSATPSMEILEPVRGFTVLSKSSLPGHTRVWAYVVRLFFDRP
jgi:hypothetical protein